VKSRIVGEKIKVNEKPFPKLMIWEKEGQVVFFQRSGLGMSITNGEWSDRFGDMKDGWEMSSFTDFTGTIELSND